MSEYRTSMLENKDARVYCDGTMMRASIPDGELRAWAVRNHRDRSLWDCYWSAMPGKVGRCTAVMDDFGNLVGVRS